VLKKATTIGQLAVDIEIGRRIKAARSSRHYFHPICPCGCTTHTGMNMGIGYRLSAISP
jgi:hypothetical protein